MQLQKTILFTLIISASSALAMDQTTSNPYDHSIVPYMPSTSNLLPRMSFKSSFTNSRLEQLRAEQGTLLAQNAVVTASQQEIASHYCAEVQDTPPSNRVYHYKPASAVKVPVHSISNELLGLAQGLLIKIYHNSIHPRYSTLQNQTKYLASSLSRELPLVQHYFCGELYRIVNEYGRYSRELAEQSISKSIRICEAPMYDQRTKKLEKQLVPSGTQIVVKSSDQNNLTQKMLCLFKSYVLYPRRK